MRLCFVCSEYPPGPHGGIGTLVQLLSRGLVRAGHQVRVTGVYPAGYPAPDYEEDHGVQVWRLREPTQRLGWLLSRRRVFRMIEEWCRQGETDLIEVPDYAAPAALWPRLPVPVITRLSGSISYFTSEMGRPLKRSTFYLERASLRRSSFWCSESRYLADKTKELFNLDSGPDAIIYNPVELPELSESPDRPRNRVVFAGTLTKKKGIVSLIKAWPRVQASCPEAELHIWGKDGPTEEGASMQKYLESQLAGAAATRVHFHGHVALDHLLEEFLKATVVVLPSYAEGFALTPLHAMAAGCPTIYSRRGSGPELIEDGHNGLLIDPDRPDEIADRIVCLLHNDGLARQLGEGGRRHVERSFSWNRLLVQNEAFYQECRRSFAHQSINVDVLELGSKKHAKRFFGIWPAAH